MVQRAVGGLKLLVLDNNGTMLDDLALAYGSVQAIFAVLDLPAPTLEQYREEITADFMKFYWKYGVPRDVTGDQLNAVRRLYFRARPGSACYRPDLEPMLQYACQRGIRLAVCSAEIQDVLIERLTMAGLANYFDQVGGQAWPRKRPMLASFLADHRCPANWAALVSDTVEDLEDARSLGMQTIGLIHPTGYNSAERIEAFRPNYTVVSFEDLQNLLAYI